MKTNSDKLIEKLDDDRLWLYRQQVIHKIEKKHSEWVSDKKVLEKIEKEIERRKDEV